MSYFLTIHNRWRKNTTERVTEKKPGASKRRVFCCMYGSPAPVARVVDHWALVHDVERVKLKIVVLVEPGADEVVKPEAGAARECQGIDHELGDGLLLCGAGFIVKDVDSAVSYLEHVDVAGESGVGLDRNLESELALHMGDVLRREDNRHFDRNRHRVGDEHEALDFVVAALVVRNGLQHEVGDAARVVALGFDLDGVEVERGFAL